MEGTVAGVRIVPPVVEFFDAEADVVHQMTLTVQNLSKCSRNIRFHGPTTSKFKIKAKIPDRAIAPGLEVSALVEYFTTENEDSQDRVILTVDNDVIEVPIIAYAPCPQMGLSGPANFGTIVADGKVLSRQVAIFNEGAVSGEFKIKYTGSKPITITPTSAVVKPGHSQLIKVEFIAKMPGIIHELAQVKLEGQPSSSLEICGQVVQRSLELLTPDESQKIDCIDFGNAYYGTDTIKSFVIFNNGPDIANFVVILEEEGEGQEVGVDLTKTTSAALASQAALDELGTTNDLTSLVTALPSQGVLKPGEKRFIHFCFSPRFTRSNKGWKLIDQPPPRRDFALFMHIETVGSVGSVVGKKNGENNGLRVEVAVVGTALPVLLSISPSPTFRFGQCAIEEQVDTLCTINNESACLPLSFMLQRVAHFHTQPKQGTINAGKSMDVLISFQPNQIGEFKPVLHLDVLGGIVENFTLDGDPTALRNTPIYTTNINLIGTGVLSETNKQLTAQVKNSDGIAHPNDRATSIRPAKRTDKVKTLFTGIERYSYVDPDYAYTDEEERQREEHKQHYLDYIDDLRTKRKQDQKKREFEELDNNVDIGIKSAKGLRPPRLSAKEITPSPKGPSPVNPQVKLLSSKSLSLEKTLSLAKPISDGLNAVPMTDIEKIDCAKRLTPQQLKLLDIGPSIIDFGQVCLRSINSRDLMISNHLDIHIYIVAKIDSRELRQTSPLSQVVPPYSVAKLTLMFESNSKGHFERSVDYTINGYHRQHIIVSAEVVPVDIELASEVVTLQPSPGALWETGLQGSITLVNNRNYIAEFTWEPIVTDQGTAFSIRPSQGVVDAYTNLMCQISYLPTFSAPGETDFALHVNSGAKKTLKCLAKVGPSSCSFVERRLLFGPVPLNLTTTKIVSIKNTSHNHAYFEIVDTHPIQGMNISPKEGVVPVGGTSEITVEFHPDAIHKFDTNIQVNIRGGKMITLRVGGTVEPPCVDIDVDTFRFGGVHCGALAKIPFKMQNLARTEARLEINLSRYMDFSLKVFDVDEIDGPVYCGDGVYSLNLCANQTIDCVLEFSPSEVAAYDFVIPVIINNIIAPSPPPSLYPPTPTPSRTNWTISDLETPVPSIMGIATPSRRVLGTALRPPLQLSHTRLEFSLPSGYFDLGIESGAGRAQGCMFVNNSDRTLSWTLHTKEAGPLLENGVFKFLHRTGSPFTPSSARKQSTIPAITLESGETFQLGVLFTPPHPGLFIAHVPVLLDDNRDYPYRILELRGELRAPQLKFEPEDIVITPTPLDVPVTVDFRIVATGYRKSATISCVVPPIELEDGSSMHVLDVSFPEGQTIKPCCNDGDDKDVSYVVHGQITFKAPSPVSFTDTVVFNDGLNKYQFPVTATADNCILTSYHFLASHREDFHIVCSQESLASILENNSSETQLPGEAVIKPCVTPARPATCASTTATSTTFGISSSTYQESSDSLTPSTFPSTPHKDELSHKGSLKDESVVSDDEGTYSVLSSMEGEEKKFLNGVVTAIQRWFSVQGWAGGQYPVTIPQSFSMALKDQSDGPPSTTAATRNSNWDNNTKKELRSVFDLVSHICGRPVPGIPLVSTLPTDPNERVRQAHWMYSTLLIFLRTQGAMLASIKPEYLLAHDDYRRWREINKKDDPNEILDDDTKQKQLKDLRKDLMKFVSVSRKAWTDVLSQIIKVLVLSRVTPQQYKKLPSPYKESQVEFNADPLCSNVYSVGERVLLAWINHHYEMQRRKDWPGSMDGSRPSCRWIVNFDLDFMDGLVLASLLSAYVPFLVSTHLNSMYLHPTTAQQCLHNVQKVVEAVKHIGLDYDVQATDIIEPNPVSIMLLCLHLYQRLPQYLPRTTVEFQGPLHTTVVKHIRLQNPSNKPLIYQVIVAGRDAEDFNATMGDSLQVPSKGNLQLPVEFKSRFLRPCSATLVLVGKRVGSPCGNTMVFNLETCINNITPIATIQCESPTYELQKVSCDITNPFPCEGEFRIVLVEAKLSFPGSNSTNNSPRSKHSKPKRNVPARTDHGQANKPRSPTKEFPRVEPDKPESPKPSPAPQLSAFWSPRPSVHLDGNGTASVEIHFLPFNMGHRQCSILFINEQIGEFLYSIEANALAPLPSPLPVADSSHSMRISSAAAARGSRGVFGGDERVVYWKCENDEKFTEDLFVPITNTARENALAIAAQQRMSDREIQRRQLTGTLCSSTVTSRIAALGLGGDIFMHASDPTVKKSLDLSQTKFRVELSSKFFKVPKWVTIPTSMEQPFGSSGKNKDSLKDTTKIPVTFEPKGPGHYPCQIVLQSAHDIRVYQLECTVSPKGSALELEFTSPAHQSVTQDIPVVNHSQQDWQLTAAIEGEGFFGPPVVLAKALVTTNYPLMFRPSYEGAVQGQLVLTNQADGTEQVYLLSGMGEKPLALDNVVIECEARQSVPHVLQVPNMTKKKIKFKVLTDLDIISGPSSVTVLPSQTAEHVIKVSPWRRGMFNGMVTFVAMSESEFEPQIPQIDDSDSENENTPQGTQRTPSPARQSSPGTNIDSLSRPYRIWYSIEVQGLPPSPEKTLDVTCATHASVGVEIEVSNPTREKAVIDVIVSGVGIYGDDTITLHPKQKAVYRLKFSPTKIGEFIGSIIFQHPVLGEFWYDLALHATAPVPSHLPILHCELGKSTYQMVRLENPTKEALILTPYNSNTHNFQLELDSNQLVLGPLSVLEIPLKFTPSDVGHSNHNAEIVFSSPELGDWIFLASGTGLMPGANEPINVYSELGGNSSIILPFRNPTDQEVIVDVVMKERTMSRSGSLFNTLRDQEAKPKDSTFCLLLKNPVSIPLPPNATLDIPVSFAPDTMQVHECTVTITVHRHDGTQWGYRDGITGSCIMNDLHWIYPIKGVPESCPVKESQAPCIECKARGRVEERIEVTLTGVAPSSSSASHAAFARTLTPIQILPNEWDYGIDYVNVPEEFRYELVFEDAEGQAALERSFGVSLIRKARNQVSGVVSLVFNFVFAPFKPFRHRAQLVVSAMTGGVWRFPIVAMATEPEVDDVINMEAAGLNKESFVGFRLTSQTRHILPFEAYFTSNSDREFSVIPPNGELLPYGTEGTLIKIGYKPTLYGKTHRAKLIVQTSDMQWTYDVFGTTPEYTPPSTQSKIAAGSQTQKRTVRQKKNYILENLKLQNTAVSSPLKGGRLVSRTTKA